jgi:HSP20 family molecular chaperone IbpA
MGNVAIQKKQTGEAPSFARAAWDPFWFMHQMFGWGRSSDAPPFDLKETNDAYVYKVKLTLPDQGDVARVKAELDHGQLTLVVPKAAAAPPEPVSPPAGRTKTNGRGSAARTPRREARAPSRRRRAK